MKRVGLQEDRQVAIPKVRICMAHDRKKIYTRLTEITFLHVVVFPFDLKISLKPDSQHKAECITY